MKHKTLAFPFIVVAFSMLTLLSISSCSTPKEFTIHGTVQKTENGKDGYTATLTGDDGNDFDAVFSRVNLGDEYRVFTPGERIEVTGDTLHLDNKLRVIVRKISH